MPEARLGAGVQRLRPSVMATLAPRIARLGPDHLPLHLGDVHWLPPEAARLHEMAFGERPEYHRYRSGAGEAGFNQAVLARLERDYQVQLNPDWLQISCGATGGLQCAAQTLLDPGDHVLLLAPCWPLLSGMCQALGAQTEEVDFFARRRQGEDLESILESARRPHSKIVYLCNPNNPGGERLLPEELGRLAQWCERQGLWLISDEVYEHFYYDGARHTSMLQFPESARNVIVAFSLSKSYAMAGHRLGYLVAHPETVKFLRRAFTHTVMFVSPQLQWSAQVALEQGEPLLARLRREGQQCRDLLYPVLAPFCPQRPDAGAYFFPRFESKEAAWDLLWRAMDEGLVMAPGEAFGDAYASHLRICFTAAPAPAIARAAEILQRLL